MSTYLIRVYGFACDEEPCSASWEDADAIGRPRAWQRARQVGWTTRDGKHYCPEHRLRQRRPRMSSGYSGYRLPPGRRGSTT